jgi:hypothetical protein
MKQCEIPLKLTIRTTLDKNFLNSIKKDIKVCVPSDNSLLLETASKICAEYVKRECYSDPKVKKVCVWIAKKLIRTDLEGQKIPNVDKSYTDKELLEMKIYICNRLNFKLY